MAIGTPTAGDDVIAATPEDSGTVIFGLEGDDTMSAGVGVNNVTLDGGPGVDTLTSGGINNTLIGGLGGDSLESTSTADNTTMVGGPGSDTLVGGGMNDTASYVGALAGVTVDLLNLTASDGEGGTDLLLGIEHVTGSAFADSLTGDPGANVLNGSAGNDTLTGGGGADVFKYSFTLTQGQGNTFTFIDFLSEKFGRDFGDHLPDCSPEHHHHKHGKDDDEHHHRHHHGGDDGHQSSEFCLTENFFEKNYKEWLKEVVVPDLLAQGFVLDANGNGKIKIGLNEVDLNDDSESLTPRIEGLTQEQIDAIFGDPRSVVLRDGHETEVTNFSNSYTSPGGGQDAVTSTDGFDAIVDFVFGEDKLEFSGLGGLTLDQFKSFFTVNEADVNGDGVTDTVLALADDTWSTTLQNVSGHTIDDFYSSSIFS